jgi:signal transduction histidine kinase
MTLSAQEEVIINEQFSDIQLRSSHLRDKSAKLTLQEIIKPEMDALFEKTSSPFFSFGADPANWWLRFRVKNTQNLPQRVVLHLNRKNFDSFQLWQKEANGVVQHLGSVGMKEPLNNRFELTDGYFYELILAPNQETVFYSMAYNRVGSMHLGLSLVTTDYFAALGRKNMFSFGLFMGVMALTILFSGFLFLQDKDRIYLFYIAYIINILLREAHEYSADFGWFPLFQRHAVSFLIGGTFSMFFRHFLQLWHLNPRLDRILKSYSLLIFILIPIIIGLTYFNHVKTLNILFKILNATNLFFTLVALLIVLRYYNNSIRARITTFAYFPLAFAFVAILLRNMTVIENYPFIQHAVMWGFIVEVMVFTTGFSMWYHQMEQESKVLKLNLALEIQQKQLEINVAENKIKDQIARDLHDDVAATMSGISLLSNIATEQFVPKLPEAGPILLQINKSAQSVSESISDLIWTVKQNSDYLNDIADRIREHASKVLEAQGIDYEINIPRELPMVDFNLETKRNIHLIYKEAMNNALKYSKCTKITIGLGFVNNYIELSVADNGIGFDFSTVKLGNGLKNLKTRAHEIGADLKIQSIVGKETVIVLVVKA